MRYQFVVTICAAGLLAACLPVDRAAQVTPGAPAADPALGQGDFVAAPPPPGRTPAERSARSDYYRGPRGQEF